MKTAIKFKRQYWPHGASYLIHEPSGIRIDKRAYKSLYDSGYRFCVDVPIPGPVTELQLATGEEFVYLTVAEEWTLKDAKARAEYFIRYLDSKKEASRCTAS